MKTDYRSRLLDLVRFTLAHAVIYGISLPLSFAAITFSFFSFLLPPHISQAVNDSLVAIFMRFMLFLTEVCVKTKLVLHGDVQRVLSKKERVVFMTNHQSAIDWQVLCMLAARQGSLAHVRFLLKSSIQYVPIFGFLIYLAGNVFINRKNFKEGKMLASLKHLQNKKIPSWLLISPEGTRYNLNNPEMFERSAQLAKGQGVKPFRHVLFPKYRGFHILVNNMRNHLDAVYDVTMFYSSTKGKEKGSHLNAPTFSEYLSSSCDTIHVHIKRIGINDVPTSEDDVKSWLNESFQKKEELLGKLYDNDKFQEDEHPFGKGIVSPPNVLLDVLGILTLVLSSIPLYITPLGRFLFIRGFIVFSLIGYAWKIADIMRTKYRALKRD